MYCFFKTPFQENYCLAAYYYELISMCRYVTLKTEKNYFHKLTCMLIHDEKSTTLLPHGLTLFTVVAVNHTVITPSVAPDFAEIMSPPNLKRDYCKHRDLQSRTTHISQSYRP